jgi:hypothetical protein
MAACARAFGAAATPVESYLKRVQELVAQQRRNVERLKAPSELVAEALFAGGAFYLGGSDLGWIREGSGRSGGVMNIGQLSPTTTVYPGDVVWLNYAGRTYDAQLQTAAELERKQCLVMAFGPRPASGVPGFQHWIDSLTPWNADQNFTVLGNVLSLWTLTAEVAAASARRGKTLVFYQSGYIASFHPELPDRNSLYRGHTFHGNGEPHMEPVQPGVAARAYLDCIDKMFQDIQAHELGKIVEVGKEMGRRSASRPALFMVNSHMMHDELWGEGKWYKEHKGDMNQLATALGSDGYLVWLGYYDGVPPQIWEAVRRAKARAAWIVVPLRGQKLNFEQYGDVFINPQWEFGDAAIVMPGYDVRILPPSGVAQLFIHEVMLCAAGAQP